MCRRFDRLHRNITQDVNSAINGEFVLQGLTEMGIWSPALNLKNRIIHEEENPTATILEAKETKPFKPSLIIVFFSSRGPGGLTENILKILHLDITVPGVAIIAAIAPKMQSEYSAPDNKPSSFGIRSVTSMACPHVTGAMAFIKSVHPQWSFSVIKSALMTTGLVMYL
ncbi:hypothetical protein OROMI_023232 [Orobanche minor]